MSLWSSNKSIYDNNKSTYIENKIKKRVDKQNAKNDYKNILTDIKKERKQEIEKQKQIEKQNMIYAKRKTKIKQKLINIPSSTIHNLIVNKGYNRRVKSHNNSMRKKLKKKLMGI